MKRTLVVAAVAALILSALAIVLPAGARPDPNRKPVEARAATAVPATPAAPATPATPAAPATLAPATQAPTSGASPARRFRFAPEFTLDDQDGHAVSLAEFEGKIVVLEWTNYECPFVKHHATAGTMRHLAEKYHDRGVVWLAINSTSHASREMDRDWVAQNKLPYPILEDFEGKVGRSFGARTTPHMFIVNAKGQIVYEGAIDDDRRIAGKPTVNYVDQALGELIAGYPVSVDKTDPYGCSVKYRGSTAAAPAPKPQS